MRWVVLYLMMVGLPLFGVTVVLRSGRDLRAPWAMDGTWRLQPTTPCAPPSPPGELRLTVSQSGPHLAAVLTGSRGVRSTLSGELQDVTFTVSNGQGVVFRGILDPAGSPRVLDGTLTGAVCVDDAASAVRVIGVRLDSTLPSGH